MTSRFSKTYSRKGGEANSKFDEVFSNKKPTPTTKWGETTYKAQLGSKRPTLKPEAPELPKRPRLEDSDSDEDPFGFDSDDETKAVTSHSVPQTKADEGEATKAASAQGSVTSTPIAPAQSSVTSISKPTPEQNVVKNSQPWSRSAPDSNQKPTAQSSVDDWNSVGTQKSFPSSNTDATLLCKDSVDAPGSSGESQSSQDGLASEGMKTTEQEPPAAPVDNIPPSPFTLRASNCRKYQRPGRPNKTSSDTADGSSNAVPAAAGAEVKPNNITTASTSTVVANAGAAAKPAAGRGRGRVRDYTVLHPSCLSVCNVTIQDTVERSIDELATPAAPPDLGDVGQMKKKSDVPPPKPTRFRPSKTKKETKLDFFGFEDKEDQGGEDGSEGSVVGSSYKIKYFGFDDLSESDSDDEESSQAKERKKAKKAAAAAAALASSGSSVDSPQPSSDSQDSQVDGNADAFDLSDDSSPGSIEGQKGHSGKQGDKSKDTASGLKKIFSGPKKSPAKAVYNARHWNQPEPEEMPPPTLSRSQTAPASLSSSSKDSNSHKDDGLFKTPPPPPKVTKSETIPTGPNQDIVTALKCRKEHKELYTVVQHVKHFNDVVEFGENQEFTDDFEYLETGLKSSQPLNTRCLSIISLATRCAMPSFRMHLRARGKVAQVFKMLSDAPQHPNLSLCTAALMYILSRDRLNMDLDRACLELMIRLLELEQDNSARQDQLTAKEVAKVKEKIRKLCETVHNKHLDLENITTGHLAMETLLSLTSKRAGDWFKEELRLLGGLDHIVDKVKECVQNLSQEEDKENLVASLWGAERCLRVLESVTVQNPENQGYLIAYKDSQLIISSARGLRHCEEMIQRYSKELNSSSLSSSGMALPHCSFSNVGKAVEDCMRAIIGVLLNLTHDNEWGSTKTGEQEELIVTALNCVLRVPQYIPQEQRFDVRVLGLGLLINLVEYSARNRHYFVDMDYIAIETCLEDSLVQPADPAAPVSTQPETEGESVPPCPAETGGESVPPCPAETGGETGGESVPPCPAESGGETGGESVPPCPAESGVESATPCPAEAQGDGADDKAKGSGALGALVKLFLERERAAIQAEAKTDDLISEAPKPALDKSGEWQETSGEIQWVAAENNDDQNENEDEKKKEEEDEEWDINKALQHAGKHMEDSIVASYTALLLGCLCQGSEVNVTTVRDHLPSGDFSIMTEMLKKFLNFMNLTCAVGTTGQKSISRVIDYLEQC